MSQTATPVAPLTATPTAKDRYGNRIEPGSIVAIGDGGFAAALIVQEIKLWKRGTHAGQPYLIGRRRYLYSNVYHTERVNFPNRTILLHPDHVEVEARMIAAELRAGQNPVPASQTEYDPEDD